MTDTHGVLLDKRVLSILSSAFKRKLVFLGKRSFVDGCSLSVAPGI